MIPVTAKTYLEPRQISKMELFEKLVNGFQLLTIFIKSSILDVWQGSEYASELEHEHFEAKDQVKKIRTLNLNKISVNKKDYFFVQRLCLLHFC